MTLDDLISDLVLGPLQSLYTSLNGSTNISPLVQARLTSYTNQALKALYSKFPLLKKELILHLEDCVHMYKLVPENAQSNNRYGFICDHHSKFEGDVIKILEVYNDKGLRYPINDTADPTSLFTPTYNTLQVPFARCGMTLSVIYQAKFTELKEFDPDYKIDLPPLLEEALIAFISSKAYSHINGDGNKATSQEFMATFEARCMEVGDKDLAGTSEVETLTKLETRGFI